MNHGVSGLRDVILGLFTDREQDLPFGCFHEDGCADTAVESGEAFIFDDFAETVYHPIVVICSPAFACL